MFDGVLPRDERIPEPDMALSPWSRELAALLLVVTVVSILAAMVFPDAFSFPGARF
jgi:hypothetical protein